jgi:hypothetical protein
MTLQLAFRKETSCSRPQKTERIALGGHILKNQELPPQSQEILYRGSHP